jgi:hypothetical protein
MGDLLYREGKITREQHEQSHELVEQSGRRMGQVLVDMGFLKPRELLPAVRRHIEDIIYSLFSWRIGEFSLTPGNPSVERIRLSRHPAALVLEGVRRKYGLDELRRRLGSPAAIVSIKSAKQVASVVGVADVSAEEREVIKLLDGERSIDEAAEKAGVEPLIATQLAFGLVALGTADVVHGGEQISTTEEIRTSALVGETDLAIDRQRVLAKFELVKESDYFMLLGVRRDATGFEIRRAYEAARRDYSVETLPGELRGELELELGSINDLIDEAFLVLADDKMRMSYLANLRD